MSRDPAALGRTAREDDECVCGGVRNLFMPTEPLHGWRHVVVSDRRIRLDLVRCIRELVDV